MSKTIILFIFLPGYEIRAVYDPGPRPHGSGNRWTLRAFPAGRCTAGCKYQRGCPASPILRFHPRRNKLRQVSGCLCGSPFSSIWMPRPEAVCVSSLAAGERRPRKCRVNAAMIPGMISAMTPAMMAHAVMPAPGVSAGSPAGDYIPPPPCAPPVLPPPPPCAPLLMSSLRIDLAVRFTPTFCLPKR